MIPTKPHYKHARPHGVLNKVSLDELKRRYYGNEDEWVNGESIQSLCRWMGIGRSSFNQYRRILKLPYRGYKRVNPRIVLRMLSKGVHPIIIAERLNCTVQNVNYIRRKKVL